MLRLFKNPDADVELDDLKSVSRTFELLRMYGSRSVVEISARGTKAIGDEDVPALTKVVEEMRVAMRADVLGKQFASK